MKITPVDGCVVDPVASLGERLTPDEDDELRRLNYMATQGMLSQRSRERLLELRLRDRRTEIRSPREFESQATGEPRGTDVGARIKSLLSRSRPLG